MWLPSASTQTDRGLRACARRSICSPISSETTVAPRSASWRLAIPVPAPQSSTSWPASVPVLASSSSNSAARIGGPGGVVVAGRFVEDREGHARHSGRLGYADDEHPGRIGRSAGTMTDMRVLVLGGTHHVGRAVVEEALARGDQVTTLTRGVSGPSAPGALALHADRTDPAALSAVLGDATWDAIDRHVERCAAGRTDGGDAASRPGRALRLRFQPIGLLLAHRHRPGRVGTGRQRRPGERRRRRLRGRQARR